MIAGHKTTGVYFPTQRGGRAVPERDFYLKNTELRIMAEVVASDKSRDIAILKLERVPDGIVAINFGKSCLPGQSIHSVGNPGASGALWSYAFGKVRQNYYIQTRLGFGKTQMQMLETTSPINPGDSGGPIVNDSGELVGLSQSYRKQHRGYAYGVDISEISWFLKKYLKPETRAVKSGEKPDNGAGGVFSNPSAATSGSFQDVDLFASALDKHQVEKCDRPNF